jgi:hypothetical protein
MDLQLPVEKGQPPPAVVALEPQTILLRQVADMLQDTEELLHILELGKRPHQR